MLSSLAKAYSLEEKFLRKSLIQIETDDHGVQQPGTHDEDLDMFGKKDQWCSAEKTSIVISTDELLQDLSRSGAVNSEDRENFNCDIS